MEQQQTIETIIGKIRRMQDLTADERKVILRHMNEQPDISESSHKDTPFYRNQKLHILYADDDPDDILFFKRTLKEINSKAKLSTAMNGQELLGLLETVTPDIIFLDLNMPCMGGFACLERIRQQRKLNKIPVIIYSTSAEQNEIDITYDSGANLYIQKPSEFSLIGRQLLYVFTLNAEDLLKRIPKEQYLLKFS